MLSTIIGFAILGLFIILLINIGSFADRFQELFNRSFIHGWYILNIILLVCFIAGMGGEVSNKVGLVICLILFAVQTIVYFTIYGLWTLGVLFYNALMIIAV